MQIRPMLAANKPWDPAKVKKHLDQDGFLYMQPKIDGFRVLMADLPRTRAWKEHPNKYVNEFQKEYADILRGQDGELVDGHIYTPETFRAGLSSLRSEDGTPEFSIYLYDYFLDLTIDYDERRKRNEDLIGKLGEIVNGVNYSAKLILTPQKIVTTMDEIASEEADLLARGWEGGILRKRSAKYKYNRSSYAHGGSMKVKRLKTFDAIVIGYEPWYENQNEATTSALGLTERSAHNAGMVPLERLGALHCRLVEHPDIEFKCGTFKGITHKERDRLWAVRDQLIGRYFEASAHDYTGGYDKPRVAVFNRWRQPFEF